MVMNKKQYIAPVLEMEGMEELEMICSSVTSVGGDAGIGLGDGVAPTEGDSRQLLFFEGFD